MPRRGWRTLEKLEFAHQVHSIIKITSATGKPGLFTGQVIEGHVNR